MTPNDIQSDLVFKALFSMPSDQLKLWVSNYIDIPVNGNVSKESFNDKPRSIIIAGENTSDTGYRISTSGIAWYSGEFNKRDGSKPFDKHTPLP